MVVLIWCLIEKTATVDSAAQTLDLFLLDGKFIIVGDFFVDLNSHLKHQMREMFFFFEKQHKMVLVYIYCFATYLGINDYLLGALERNNLCITGWVATMVYESCQIAEFGRINHCKQKQLIKHFLCSSPSRTIFFFFKIFGARK